MNVQMMHRRTQGGEGQNKAGKKRRQESVTSVLPPSSVFLCLHGAHILSGKVVLGLVWPDLFTLQARLQFSNTYQNIYSLLYLYKLVSHSLSLHIYAFSACCWLVSLCTLLLNLNILFLVFIFVSTFFLQCNLMVQDNFSWYWEHRALVATTLGVKILFA